jgi:serine/threonine protein kinase
MGCKGSSPEPKEQKSNEGEEVKGGTQSGAAPSSTSTSNTQTQTSSTAPVARKTSSESNTAAGSPSTNAGSSGKPNETQHPAAGKAETSNSPAAVASPDLKERSKASLVPFQLQMLEDPNTIQYLRPWLGVGDAEGTNEQEPTSAKKNNRYQRALDLLKFQSTKKLIGKGGTASVYFGTVSLPATTAPQQGSDRPTEAQNSASASGALLGVVAVKEVDVDKAELFGVLEKEHDALRLLIDSPHVVQVYHFESVGLKARIYMELCPKGTLRSYAKNKLRLAQERHSASTQNAAESSSAVFRLHELEVRSYIRHALMGLAYLHSCQVLHRDVKPENMLLVAGFSWDRFRASVLKTATTSAVKGELPNLGGESAVMVKLSDFGTAKLSVFGGVCATTANVVGTVPYMSPESIMGKYSEGSDIWALGVSFCELCLSTPLGAVEGAESSGGAKGNQASKREDASGGVWSRFGPLDSFGLLLKIGGLREGDHYPDIPSHLSPNLRELLKSQFFSYSVKGRPSAEELLRHRYFADPIPSQELLAEMEPLPT